MNVSKTDLLAVLFQQKWEKRTGALSEIVAITLVSNPAPGCLRTLCTNYTPVVWLRCMKDSHMWISCSTSYWSKWVVLSVPGVKVMQLWKEVYEAATEYYRASLNHCV